MEHTPWQVKLAYKNFKRLFHQYYILKEEVPNPLVKMPKYRVLKTALNMG